MTTRGVTVMLTEEAKAELRKAHKAMRDLKDAMKALEDMGVAIKLREHNAQWFLDARVYTQPIRGADFMEPATEACHGN
jgi:hypothetical protein